VRRPIMDPQHNIFVQVISSWILPLSFSITITNANKSNIFVLRHLFSWRGTPHLLLHKYALFYNLFQSWLFNNIQQLTTNNYWSIIHVIYDLQPKSLRIIRLWYQLMYMKTKDNEICYKLKPSKIKNTIIIERHLKYLIFINLILPCQKLSQSFI
jgi:hypothetical protein